MGQDGPRGASSRPRPEQILDIKGTRQRRIAELGAGNQRPVDPPCPSPDISKDHSKDLSKDLSKCLNNRSVLNHMGGYGA